MSRASAWFVHTSVAAVGVTGAIYAWMAWVAEPTDEFALVNHPWQPTTRDLHLLAAPVLVFGCGLLWRTHVWGRLLARFEQRRLTGLLLALLLLPMTASGYLLQVSADGWRTLWVWIHGIASVGWIVAYLVHQLSGREEESSEE